MDIKKFKSYVHPYHNVIGIGDRLMGKVLYKYMPIENALLCLKKNNLRFTDPRKWDDPFEKYF